MTEIARHARKQLFHCRIDGIGARRDVIEIDRCGGKTGMAEQALNLLQRIAEQLTIALHGACRGGRFGNAALDQHRQHVHRERMPELMGTDANRNAGIRASAASPGEDRFP